MRIDNLKTVEYSGKTYEVDFGSVNDDNVPIFVLKDCHEELLKFSKFGNELPISKVFPDNKIVSRPYYT